MRDPYPVDVVVTLLREEGVPLEYVEATVTADQLARGVDLLRTPGNKITFISGCTCEDQVWQSVRVSSADPSLLVALSVGDQVVCNPTPSDVKQRITKMRLIPSGSVVRAVALSAHAPASSRIVLEIFGWAIVYTMLPTVKEALRTMDAS